MSRFLFNFPRTKRLHLAAGPQRGVTLLEMLVVMVIMAMVTLLVSQALDQMARIERLLQGTRLESANRLVQVAWLTEALESLLPTEQDSPHRFDGAEQHLSGLTTAPPGEQVLGIARLQLTMVYLPRSDETELRLALASPQEDLPPGLTPPDFRVLSRWPGRKGHFLYLDLAGQWHTRWGPAARTVLAEPAKPLLPEAIMVVTGQPDVPSFVAAMRVAPVGMPSRKRFVEL